MNTALEVQFLLLLNDQCLPKGIHNNSLQQQTHAVHKQKVTESNMDTSSLHLPIEVQPSALVHSEYSSIF